MFSRTRKSSFQQSTTYKQRSASQNGHKGKCNSEVAQGQVQNEQPRQLNRRQTNDTWKCRGWTPHKKREGGGVGCRNRGREACEKGSVEDLVTAREGQEERQEKEDQPNPNTSAAHPRAPTSRQRRPSLNAHEQADASPISPCKARQTGMGALHLQGSFTHPPTTSGTTQLRVSPEEHTIYFQSNLQEAEGTRYIFSDREGATYGTVPQAHRNGIEKKKKKYSRSRQHETLMGQKAESIYQPSNS
jgi:hypothetical protein